MKRFVFGGLLAILLLSADSLTAQTRGLTACIQPFSKVDAAELKSVTRGIEYFFGFNTKILPIIPLPEEAYFEPRNRYLAPKLVEFLAKMKPEDCDYIHGFTTWDISMLTAEDIDFGIIGWADIVGNNASVLSNFRIKLLDSVDTGKALVKVALHEIVHTHGFIHISRPECLMSEWDNQHDRETIYLCPETREYIREKHGLEFPERTDFDWGFILGNDDSQAGASLK